MKHQTAGPGADPVWPRGSEPVLIEFTGDAARIRAFLPVLDGLIGSGLAVLKPVTVMRRADAPGVIVAATG